MKNIIKPALYFMCFLMVVFLTYAPNPALVYENAAKAILAIAVLGVVYEIIKTIKSNAFTTMYGIVTVQLVLAINLVMAFIAYDWGYTLRPIKGGESNNDLIGAIFLSTLILVAILLKYLQSDKFRK